MVIIGYKTDKTTLSDLDTVFANIERQIKRTAKKEYHELLAREIESICDNVSLNVYPAPEGAIMDVAVQNLTARIHAASAIGAQTRYNFQVYAHLLSDGEETYIKLICPNTAYQKAFEKNLEPFGLSKTECDDKNNGKTKKWQQLHAMYKDREPAAYNLSPLVMPSEEEIVFADVKTRAARIARHKLTNRFLKEASGGMDIPPHLLMPYMDDAMERLTSKEAESDLRQEELLLCGILMDLNKEETKEMIFHGRKNPEEATDTRE